MLSSFKLAGKLITQLPRVIDNYWNQVVLLVKNQLTGNTSVGPIKPSAVSNVTGKDGSTKIPFGLSVKYSASNPYNSTTVGSLNYDSSYSADKYAYFNQPFSTNQQGSTTQPFTLEFWLKNPQPSSAGDFTIFANNSYSFAPDPLVDSTGNAIYNHSISGGSSATLNCQLYLSTTQLIITSIPVLVGKVGFWPNLPVTISYISNSVQTSVQTRLIDCNNKTDIFSTSTTLKILDNIPDKASNIIVSIKLNYETINDANNYQSLPSGYAFDDSPNKVYWRIYLNQTSTNYSIYLETKLTTMSTDPGLGCYYGGSRSVGESGSEIYVGTTTKSYTFTFALLSNATTTDWQHIALTKLGNNLFSFCNGTLISTKNVTTSNFDGMSVGFDGIAGASNTGTFLIPSRAYILPKSAYFITEIRRLIGQSLFPVQPSTLTPGTKYFTPQTSNITVPPTSGITASGWTANNAAVYIASNQAVDILSFPTSYLVYDNSTYTTQITQTAYSENFPTLQQSNTNSIDNLNVIKYSSSDLSSAYLEYTTADNNLFNLGSGTITANLATNSDTITVTSVNIPGGLITKNMLLANSATGVRTNTLIAGQVLPLQTGEQIGGVGRYKLKNNLGATQTASANVTNQPITIQNFEFTIDFWINPTPPVSSSSYIYYILSQQLSNSLSTISGSSILINYSAGSIRVYIAGASRLQFGLSPNQWSHVAITRTATPISTGSSTAKYTLYINGYPYATYIGTTLSYGLSQSMIIGGTNISLSNSNNTLCFDGQIFDLRITKCVDRYLGVSFTPPSQRVPTTGA